MTSVISEKASFKATNRFLEDRFQNWNYQFSWLKTLPSLNVASSLIGIEFCTTDIHQVIDNLPQLLSLGCNHFQWTLGQPEEIAFVHNSPFAEYFRNSSAITSRESIILSLHFPLELGQFSLKELFEQTKEVMEIEHWDRIILNPLTNLSEHVKDFGSSQDSMGLYFLEKMISVDMLRELNENPAPHIQIPFNFVQFKNFLRNQWEVGDTRLSMPKLFERWSSSVSFRSPFKMDIDVQASSLLAEEVNPWKDYGAQVQAAFGQLQERETLLNTDLLELKLLEEENNRLPFSFVDFLKEASHRGKDVEDWEHYISATWYPAFQHQIRVWTSKIPTSYQEQWKQHIQEYMQSVFEIMGGHSEYLRGIQAQRMRPFIQVIDNYLPDRLMHLTFGAKTLLVLCSTPWPDTVLFPWVDLDSSVEYLGLMRYPLLNNAGTILKELSNLKTPFTSSEHEDNPLLHPEKFTL